jgi:hypothetical protein
MGGTEWRLGKADIVSDVGGRQGGRQSLEGIFGSVCAFERSVDAPKRKLTILDLCLDVLPREFSTPMFWSQAELEELKGTSIYGSAFPPSLELLLTSYRTHWQSTTSTGKIGIEEATKEYTDRLLPLIQAHPELFPPAKFDSCFSLEWFHIQGSRILSRSFHIEGPKGASFITFLCGL